MSASIAIQSVSSIGTRRAEIIESGQQSEVSPGKVRTSIQSVSTTGVRQVDSSQVLPPNLLSFPSEFDNAYWTAGTTRIALTADADTAPDGSGADKAAATAESGSHAIQKTSVAVESGKSYRLFLDAKPAGYNFLGLLLSGASAGKYFNVSTGAVLGDFVASPDGSAISAQPGGYYRCSIDFTATGSTTTVGFYLSDNGSGFIFTGDGTSGLNIARAYFHEI